jgi:hypothetical protein
MATTLAMDTTAGSSFGLHIAKDHTLPGGRDATPVQRHRSKGSCGMVIVRAP